MIRPTVAGDADALLELVVAAGLFPADGLDELRGVLDGYLGGGLGPDHVWLTDDEGGPAGVAYYAPERMAEGAWNLYLIAVRPDRQRRGRGRALLGHVERSLAARGGRLLLVETSGLAGFERTRAFYGACGYEVEARVRDFYKAAEDKVIFRKLLAAAGA